MARNRHAIKVLEPISRGVAQMGASARIMAVFAVIATAMAAAALIRSSSGLSAGNITLSNRNGVLAGTVCGRRMLDSTYSYVGPARRFASGRHGLPTYGSKRSDFPADKAGVIIHPGQLLARYIFKANTVYYFEPSARPYSTGGNIVYTGDNVSMVGGYANGQRAVIDGAGKGPFTDYDDMSTGNVFEYLTFRDFLSNRNGSVFNLLSRPGWKYFYDTIGPNEYGPSGAGRGSDGGYAISMGGNGIVAHDCITHNAQGALNIYSPTQRDITGDLVEDNELSYNGLGEYPEVTGNPNSCGCSGGMKFFETRNIKVIGNYVHDNYNAGIWGDWNNLGADITGNYVADNWGIGIDYEASFNANISNNIITGNGWDSHGLWPSGGNYSCLAAGLTGTLTSGNTYTSVAVWGTSVALPEGAKIDLFSTGLNQGAEQVVTVSRAVPTGATMIPVQSFVANTTYGDTAVVGSPQICEFGLGPTGGPYDNPYAAIYVDSAGNKVVHSRYRGHVFITNNVLVNNFGGVQVYTDAGRFSGDIADCGSPLGNAVRTYRIDSNQLQMSDAVWTSSSDIKSVNGTMQTCDKAGLSIDAVRAFSRVCRTCRWYAFGTFLPLHGSLLARSPEPTAHSIAVVSAASLPTLGAPLQSGETYSTLHVSALPSAVLPFTYLTISNGSNSLDVQASGSAPAGAKTIPIITITANASYAAGAIIGPTHVFLSAPGGCGLYDLAGARPGAVTGSPPAHYWDDCIFGAANITVAHNIFKVNSNKVANCSPAKNDCGFMTAASFAPGADAMWQIYSPYYLKDISVATSPLHAVWQHNEYLWSGPGGWHFNAGQLGARGYITLKKWRETNKQDAGSVFMRG